MLSLILFLIIIYVIVGSTSAVVHGLPWLTVLAVVLLLATLVFGGTRLPRR